ncbi:unnamed protein product [Allacma fusca]|uniref:Sodium/nucleoside cotransporter n=1 Tax=Allacma fusca TaxID=39272 RepID=A0A8J2M8V2_9HEXA|nr:unnamed protein product [Allacma fusca]
MENKGFEMSETPQNNEKSLGVGQKSNTFRNAVLANNDPGTGPPGENKDDDNPRDKKLRHGVLVPVEEEEKLPPEEDLEDDSTPNIFGRIVVAIRSAIFQAVTTNKRIFNIGVMVLGALAFNAYFIGAIHYALTYKDRVDWCDGVGFLVIIVGVVYWSLFYYYFLKRFVWKKFRRGIVQPIQKIFAPLKGRWFVKYAWGIACLAAAIAFVVVDAKDEPRRLISAAGVVGILAICLIFSKHPGRVNWGHVFWGLGLQFVFGVMILRWDGGRDAFDCLSSKIKTFLDFSLAGSDFVYDHLSTGVNLNFTSGDTLVLQPLFAFKSLSVIFFFSFFINILYYYGMMMWVITKLGWVLQTTVGTTAAESMNAAANIFIGQSEAPILIKPFLGVMTNSELHAVMTSGFATIAGSVMGAYISFGINPSYLLSSSIMAAPAALALSKLVYPETKKSRTTADQLKSISLKQEGNALDAASAGAAQGLMLIGNIIANIIAFMSFVAFLNSLVHWFGVMVGLDELSFEWILSKVFIPVAYIIGIEDKDVEDVALLLGLKTVVNEFVAYQRMMTMKTLSERSKAVATYALCSFANFSSIGIQLGGIGFMAPERRADLTKVIWYAFFAGSACGVLNACIAGTLIASPDALADDMFNSTTSSYDF